MNRRASRCRRISSKPLWPLPPLGGSRFVSAAALVASVTTSQVASADTVLVWTGGQSHGGITAASSTLTSQGHSVTTSSTFPSDLSAFDTIWAMDFFNGQNRSPADREFLMARSLTALVGRKVRREGAFSDALSSF